MIITNDYLDNGHFCAFISEEEKGMINPWPDDKGLLPCDLSMGYFDIQGLGRLHVYPIQMFKEKIKTQ